MAKVQSAGFLIFRDTPRPAFLLMQHANRWDLPKGHLDKGETLKQCALRELEEETGIAAKQMRMDPDFVFEHEYQVIPKKSPKPQRKRLTIYLGHLKTPDIKIRPTEHLGFQWWDWNPPHLIQPKTIDPLLESVAAYFAEHPKRSPGAKAS